MRNGLVMQNRSAGKAFVPVLGVVAALSVGVAVVAVVLQIQERDKRQAKERELLLVVAERDELSGELEDMKASKARTEEELDNVSRKLGVAQDDLREAREAKKVLAQSVEDREKEISRLTQELEEAQRLSEEAQQKLAEAQAERDDMRQKFSELEQAKSDLESRVAKLTGRPTIELEKVRVTGDKDIVDKGSVKEPASDLNYIPQGEVVVINREYEFIVMNLGRNQGLTMGQEFQIVRDNKVLGHVKIEKIYDELSAATILPDSQKDQIREGDVVKAL